MITFDPSDKEHITTLLRDYLAKELGVEIGRFDAEFLLDFVTSKIGAHYYNRGLFDAQAAMLKRIDEIGETIYALEQPTA